ncbi:integrase core domain-containing protein [Spirillospora sp. NPDC048819]|uniref:IS3 family transposase n=1 Tax=Spirillospora sp. NPDC048819 TaxID=3155268 RepID=UPI0033C721D6
MLHQGRRACRGVSVAACGSGTAYCSALDKAATEAFNSTLKVEFVHRQHFTTRAGARIKVATWIADFYNTHRRHSANDGLSPITFERQPAAGSRQKREGDQQPSSGPKWHNNVSTL